jgi:hypothetical protein
MIRQPQWSQTGASLWIAHSKLSNTWTEGGYHDWDPVTGLFSAWPSDPEITPSEEVLGAACPDLDNDGRLDLFLADAGPDHGYDQGDGWTRTAVAETGASTGVSPADADGDGDLDLFVTSSPDNRLYRNDEPDNARHFQLELEAAVGTCAGGQRILRDDIGGHAVLLDPTGAVVGGRQEVNGGGGRGATGWPVLHWGVDPALPLVVEIDMLYLGDPPYALEVVPDTLGFPHRLRVATDDHDGDGILDVDEPGDFDGDGVYPDAFDRDADGDTIPDAVEAGDADPCTPPVDSDRDGAPDASDPDSDDDGLLDIDEVGLHGTDPTVADTDAGGRTDREEIELDGTDPLDPEDDLLDADGDGLAEGQDPDDCDADTDDDGLADGDEVYVHGTSPILADTDGDSILDGTEAGVAAPGPGTGPAFVPDADPLTWTDPLLPDSDGDGLPDGAEDADRDGRHVPPETDATRADTDGGGVDDGLELSRGTDPNDPADDAASGPGGDGAPPLDRSSGGDRTGIAGIVGCGCASDATRGSWLALVLIACRRRRAARGA